MFRIVPEVEPYAWMFARDVDCRNKPVPPYTGNMTFMLPFKRENPSRHAVRIKLCQGIADYNLEGMCLKLQSEQTWRTTGENNRILGGIYGFSLLFFSYPRSERILFLYSVLLLLLTLPNKVSLALFELDGV